MPFDLHSRRYLPALSITAPIHPAFDYLLPPCVPFRSPSHVVQNERARWQLLLGNQSVMRRVTDYLLHWKSGEGADESKGEGSSGEVWLLDQKWMDAAIQNTPLKRFGTAKEVADAVVFLASTHANYITGQTLRLDGGYSI